MSEVRGKPNRRKPVLKNLYQVDFIPPELFFQPWFINTLNRYKVRDPQQNFDNGFLSGKEVINPPYQLINGIDWANSDIIIFWATPKIPLPIHSDIDKTYPQFGLGNGLNFNFYNSSIVNFYREENLISTSVSDEPIPENTSDDEYVIYRNYKKSTAKTYTTSMPPSETYNINAGDTYIINTTTPHQLFAEPGRICVSVRCRAFNGTPWELMVDYFKDSIKR